MGKRNVSRVMGKLASALAASALTFGILEAAMSAPAQEPLFLTAPVKPLMMLNMSNDHQLYFKLYDDYTDLDGDGQPETTYTHTYDYYGYFDSDKCYVYSTTDARFNPASATGTTGYCNTGGATSQWSGNFLNWATMTRIDAVRKILYGGYRSTDDASLTILERAFLPHDAHAFAKFYNGSDISKLTPFSVTSGQSGTPATGITICNTTNGSGYSQDVTNPPLLRVAKGNYSLWASNERWQCRWREDMSNADQGVNSNESSKTKIYAYSDSPKKSDASLGDGDYNVRVRVCDPSFLGENCTSYPGGNVKPTGLLQEYGESGEILFGLMTGSYGKNKSGGVLRKNIGNMKDEINHDTDGTFKSAPAGGGVINTLNLLRIYGYSYDTGEYSVNNGGSTTTTNKSDQCPFGLTGFEDGKCTNWGNPQSEIYLESLRYFGGNSKNSEFDTDDSGYITGLTTATWADPLNSTNYCAPLSVIQFNASTSSFDGDTPGASGIGLSNVSEWVNKVGTAEGIHGKKFFVGSNGTNNDQLCTPKTVSALSDVDGTCPDAPRLEGSYNIAGLAYYARTNSIRGDLPGDQKVRTLGVTLSSATPSITVPVPDGSGKVVNILPACQNQQTHDGVREGNCAIVDFKIISQSTATGVNEGQVYINWEAAEQGGDFDSDMWGILSYKVTAAQLTITTDVMQQSSSRPLGFGYVISGTTSDGFHAHSGINSFDFTAAEAPAGATINGCVDCATDDSATTNAYVIGTSSAEPLEMPLYYAAKWGGYLENLSSTEQIASGEPESYFHATDPRELEASLRNAFARVADSIGSASAVSTNSTRMAEGARLYQARFNTRNWSGEILSYEFDQYGKLKSAPLTTNSTMTTGVMNSSTRKVYTYTGSATPADFIWTNLTEAQKAHLRDGDSDLVALDRLNWLRGASVDGLRVREKVGNHELLLGDIVNSSPTYLGGRDMRYDRLPVEAGGGQTYRDYLKIKRAQTPRIFVGSNDGMFHAFDANTLKELFAYVPVGAYPKLAEITKPGYGQNGSGNPHQYLVDGPIAIGDAYLGDKWTSIVVGSLGAGGKGIFALDVSGAKPKVLFELNNLDGLSPLGFVMGQPYIVPLKNNGGVRWAVVFGNGVEANSTRLYYVDLENPYTVNTLIADETGTGLSAPALLPNGAGLIEFVYAGDMKGNLWKFDLYNESSSKWAVSKLFTATTTGDPTQTQPIIASPELGVNSQRDHATMVYFGTGRYLYSGDNTTAVPSQTFYAVIDEGTTVSRDSLYAKTITSPEAGKRIIDNGGDPWTSHNGWYMDLPTQGERVITKPILLQDKLIFVTLIPSSVACQFGGTSWIMEVPAIGDKYVNHTILGDNVYNDFLVLGEIGLGLLAPPTGENADGSTESGGPNCGEGEFPARVYALGSNGELKSEDGCIPSGALGRTSWRQLR
jgi:type IV pilus assembly protein PilY1